MMHATIWFLCSNKYLCSTYWVVYYVVWSSMYMDIIFGVCVCGDYMLFSPKFNVMQGLPWHWNYYENGILLLKWRSIFILNCFVFWLTVDELSCFMFDIILKHSKSTNKNIFILNLFMEIFFFFIFLLLKFSFHFHNSFFDVIDEHWCKRRISNP